MTTGATVVIPERLKPRDVMRVWGLSRDQWKRATKIFDLEPVSPYPGAKPFYRRDVVVRELGVPKG